MLEVLFNPRCSKCRQVVAVLSERNVAFRTRDYQAEPLNLDELRQLRKKLGVPPERWTREKLEGSEDEQLAHLAAHPEVLQRPIVIWETRAAVVRTPEEIQALE